MYTKATTFHIALTGHRPGRLAGYDLNVPFYDGLRSSLRSLTEQALERHPHLVLHSGMALGADTVWSEVILQLRDAHHGRVLFVAEVPVLSQPSRWRECDQRRWRSHVDAADQVNVYAQSYSPAAMWARNEGMIDAAQALIAVWDGQPGGGTAGAVAYARKSNKKVVTLDPAELHGQTATHPNKN